MLEALTAPALVVLAAGYAIGIDRLWERAGHGRVVAPWQAGCMAGGFATLVAALIGPVDDAASHDLAVHMVQHVLLIGVAAPLLAAGAPVTVVVHALPDGVRARVLPGWRCVLRFETGAAWPALTAAALLLQAATVAAWHLPALYDAALAHPALHWLEHAAFLATAMFFWWLVLGAGRIARRGPGVVALFVAMLVGSALGVAMTIARTPWYPWYTTHSVHPLRDQQIAGALMWGFGTMAFVAGGVALFASWLLAIERAQARAAHRTGS
jgi:cytochrome c oxidase assembly factor CtaG